MFIMLMSVSEILLCNSLLKSENENITGIHLSDHLWRLNPESWNYPQTAKQHFHAVYTSEV